MAEEGDRDAKAGERFLPPNTKVGTTPPAIKIPVGERFEIISRTRGKYGGKLLISQDDLAKEKLSSFATVNRRENDYRLPLTKNVFYVSDLKIHIRSAVWSYDRTDSKPVY